MKQNTLNSSLSARVEKTRSALTEAEGQLTELQALHTADQRELATLQATMAARLNDKDEFITTLQGAV